MPSHLTSGKCVVCFTAGPLMTLKKDEMYEKIMKLHFDGLKVEVKPKDLLNDVCHRCFDELVEQYDTNTMCIQLELHMEKLKKRLLARTLAACAKKKPYIDNKESKLHKNIYDAWANVNLKDEPGPNKRVKLESYLETTKEDKTKNKVDEKDTKAAFRKIKTEPTTSSSTAKSKI